MRTSKTGKRCRFLAEEDGPTAVEYAVMMFLMLMAFLCCGGCMYWVFPGVDSTSLSRSETPLTTLALSLLAFTLLFVAFVALSRHLHLQIATAGWLAVLLLDAVITVGGAYYWFDYRPRARLEADHRSCAEANVPELQQLLDDLEKEIVNLEKQTDQLKTELVRNGINPTKDPDYSRWKQSVEGMRKDRKELLKCRQEVYIEFKKIELSNPGGDSEKERAAKVKRARELVERVRDALITLRREAGE